MWLIVSQVVVAAAMMGVIWLVQMLVYPQFLEVGEGNFQNYHAQHMKGISYVVLPLMLAEFGLSVFSIWYFWKSDVLIWVAVASGLTAALWLTTFLIHVPLHVKLEVGYSREAIEKLISTNWIRTVLWTVRVGLLTVIGYKVVV